MAYADQVIAAESGGNPNATNPYSSAAGLGGFTNQTWLDTVRAHRPDLMRQYSPQEILSMRSDPRLASEMIDALASDNADVLRRKGLPVNQGTLYLAHFAGPGGASGLLNADDAAPVSSVLSPDAMRANPFLAKMTVGDLKAWAARKGGGPAPAASQTATMAQPQSAEQPEVDATTAALQGGGGAAGAGAPASASALPALPGGSAATLAQVPAMLAASEQQIRPVEPVKINFPVPPGIARARMLARAMVMRPIG
jgi:hypothetical protein